MDTAAGATIVTAESVVAEAEAIATDMTIEATEEEEVDAATTTIAPIVTVMTEATEEIAVEEAMAEAATTDHPAAHHQSRPEAMALHVTLHVTLRHRVITTTVHVATTSSKVQR